MLLALLVFLDANLGKYAVMGSTNRLSFFPRSLPSPTKYNPKPCFLDETIQVQHQPSSADALDGYVRNRIIRYDLV
ncbi:MAG TPA: hypothetical protein DDZ97_13615 [Deltaproteobacteria bacterium]|nr:hypothetical protein [Deltaproteobacteria bacterium]